MKSIKLFIEVDKKMFYVALKFKRLPINVYMAKNYNWFQVCVNNNHYKLC